MDPNELEKPFVEDQRVEITDLPGYTSLANQVRRQWVRFALWVHRRRWLQVVSLLLLGILCLVLLLRDIPDAHFSLFNTFFDSINDNNAPSLNIDQFYFRLGPTWARLTIDGQPIANPPLPGHGAPLRLAPGIHHIRWQTPPFSAQTCTIAVPSKLSDTCLLSETTNTPDKQRAWVVTFGASLLTLATDQRRALISAIVQALNQLQPSAIVNPGEHFIDTRNLSGPIVRTRQELTATLSLTLNDNISNDGPCAGGETNTGACQIDGQDCYALCTQPSDLSNAWNVVALVQSSWTYRDPDGHVVATHMPDELGGPSFSIIFSP